MKTFRFVIFFFCVSIIFSSRASSAELNLVLTHNESKVTLKLIDTNDDGKYDSASILDNNEIIINNAKINFIIKTEENNSSSNQLFELPQSFLYQLIDFKTNSKLTFKAKIKAKYNCSELDISLDAKSNTLNIYSENFTKSYNIRNNEDISGLNNNVLIFKNTKPTNILVFDMSGKLVLNKDYDGNSAISMNHLPNGKYFIEYLDSGLLNVVIHNKN